MKISELMKELQEIADRHGDLKCAIVHHDALYPYEGIPKIRPSPIVKSYSPETFSFSEKLDTLIMLDMTVMKNRELRPTRCNNPSTVVR